MAPSSTLSRASATQTKTIIWLLVVFAATNAAIAWFTVEGAALKFGGDATSWYQPTLSLLEHGDFVDPDDPSKLLTMRPPLYPIFAASALWLSGGAIWSVTVGQIALLFATGLLAREMTERSLPGYGNLMLALVIFNPNALGTAHLFQSDTLYAFLVTAVSCNLLIFAQSPNLYLGVGCGALLGLSLLARTTGQYLLFVWPVALMLLGIFATGWRAWARLLAIGLVSTSVALAVNFPWMLHNQRAGEGLVLTTNYLKSYFLWDNIAYLEKYHRDIGQTDAENAAIARQKQLAERYGPGFDRLTDREKYAYLEQQGREQFLSYPPRAFARAFGWAWAQFYGVPGVSNFLNLFGLGEQTAFARYRGQAYDNYVQAGIDALKNASPAFIVLTAGGFLFVVLVRILGLVGAATIIRRRLWPVGLVVGAGLGYFTLIHLFVANSRYRLPVEPLLFLLALYGLDGCRRRPVTS
jgi:4-amino-4-deoxy-L-arabinose transferase-like glycosyltransferase